MIRTYSNFIEYIKTDLHVRTQKISIIKFMTDPVTRFHWYLRLLELLQSKKTLRPVFYIIKFLFLSLSQRLGFSIPINTLGKGVYIPHWGTIVVNSKAKIGDFTVLNVDTVIGRHPSSKNKVPTIGRGVYIAPGAKIYGEIVIGDCCVIGANSVVNRNIPGGYLVVGAPAKLIHQLTENSYAEFDIKMEFNANEI